jgi:nucleotide-binding universal stress UspA family protein
MGVIEATIVVAKPNATVFAASIIGMVLMVRYGMRFVKGTPAAAATAMEMQDLLLALEQPPLAMGPEQGRIMLAARGRGQAEFAVDMARRRKAALFCVYVRTLRLMDVAPGTVPQVKDDPEAITSLGGVAVLARQHNVPFYPIYVCSDEIADEILDYTVTFGCDTLILGKSRRRALSRAVEGDVVTRIATHLPSEVALITRDDAPHPLAPPESPALPVATNSRAAAGSGADPTVVGDGTVPHS